MVKTIYLSDGNMETDLKGKISHIPEFTDEALLPVFEAVINSIDAIEDRKKEGKTERGEIVVTIIREKSVPSSLVDSSGDIDDKSHVKKSGGPPAIVDFIIEDNGIGFTEENFKSFNLADSTWKEDRGGKGVGRFNWLKAFESVEIESVYQNNGTRFLRRFDFTLKDKEKGKEVTPKSNEITDKEIRTVVKLKNFKKIYRESPSAFKSSDKIAQRILEHFLPYYIDGSSLYPLIVIVDGKNRINLDKEYDELKSRIIEDSVIISGITFKICHVGLLSTKQDRHQIVYCAHGRDVKSSNLKNILGTSVIFKNGEKIYYAAYVSGHYLNEHVNCLRRTFDFPKNDYPGIDGNSEISEETLETEIIKKVKEHLSDHLKEIKTKKEQLVRAVISENPVLRSILTTYPEVYNEIKPSDSEKQIIETLYKKKGQERYKNQEKYKTILKTQVESYAEIEKQCKEITQDLDIDQKNDLAQYMVSRKLLIQLLERKIESDKLDKYQKEEIIHDIIFPRKTTTDQLSVDNVNLWLIDDQLIFHEFAASDKPLKDFTSSDSDLRPDIIIFSEGDNNQVLDEVSIFELKRPMTGKIPKDPISYMYDIIEKLKHKAIKNHGRLIRCDEKTKFYCYVICDITGDFDRIIRDHAMYQLSYNLGYYKYQDNLHAHVWVTSFDDLIKTAKKRNALFFEKLGII